MFRVISWIGFLFQGCDSRNHTNAHERDCEASPDVLRVCAADELFQICIALVSQLLVNADS